MKKHQEALGLVNYSLTSIGSTAKKKRLEYENIISIKNRNVEQQNGVGVMELVLRKWTLHKFTMQSAVIGYR